MSSWVLILWGPSVIFMGTCGTSESWTYTWKELNRRSQKRRARRRTEPLGTDSSMTKVKRMAWIPSKGMRVRVDFASLEERRKGKQMVLEITRKLWKQGTIYKNGYNTKKVNSQAKKLLRLSKCFLSAFSLKKQKRKEIKEHISHLNL